MGAELGERRSRGCVGKRYCCRLGEWNSGRVVVWRSG